MLVRVTDFSVPAAQGLLGGRLSRLGQVVVLAGPNGSGKTRLLRRLESELTMAADVLKQLASIEAQPARNHAVLVHHRIQLDRLNIKLSAASPDVRIVRFVPEGLVLVDPGNAVPNQLQEAKVNFATIPPKAWAGEALKYVQCVQNDWFEATHPLTSAPSERDAAVAAYAALQATILELVGLALTRSSKGQIVLNDRRASDVISTLSAGQRVLLTTSAGKRWPIMRRS